MSIRTVARRLAPGLLSDRARQYERTLRVRSGRTALAETVARDNGSTVTAGPFRGLSYEGIDLAVVDAAAAKLTGTYERDLASYFCAASRIETFIDVGAADGYYAVGFAVANPNSAVYAFDLSGEARRLCSSLAHRNGVADRVHIANRFDKRAAAQLPTADALVLIDIEGGEAALLIQPVIDALREAHIVIEMHEHLAPGVSETLPRRLERTHQVRRVYETERTIPPELSDWSSEDAMRAIDEMRHPGMHWLICEPHTVP